MLLNQSIDAHVTEFYAIFAQFMRNNFWRPAKFQMLLDEAQKLDVSPFSVLVRLFSAFYRSILSYVRKVFAFIFSSTYFFTNR